MAYTNKELEKMSTEQLISVLVTQSSFTTKESRQIEDKVFKTLAKRGVIDYDAMKHE